MYQTIYQTRSKEEQSENQAQFDEGQSEKQAQIEKGLDTLRNQLALRQQYLIIGLPLKRTEQTLLTTRR